MQLKILAPTTPTTPWAFSHCLTFIENCPRAAGLVSEKNILVIKIKIGQEQSRDFEGMNSYRTFAIPQLELKGESMHEYNQSHKGLFIK